MMLTAEIARIVMQLTGAAFAGACLYIMLAQQPVRMARPAAAALEDFRDTIPRAERLQAPLLIVCLVAVAAKLILAFEWTVAVGGVLMMAVLVQTIATVLPINRRLLSGEASDHVGGALSSLSRWGGLHAARTAVSVIGAVALLL